ncbi:hypothetical protein CYMTET_18435 [Cymbomonas tetramitiformis]|uniref:NAD-dependent epimerase/dehydratase domain-containing protein n=1 Tax=Cymbomonas tetramitiformis TaxID=36881 RepID=A0AAE0G840_9CHLO|nr:hypothetical protein CYMTET_18435 [Cymbomonas tetramitiformis]
MGLYTVTGGTGFLGEHLVQQLAAEGHEVRVVARGNLTTTQHPCVKFVEGNILDLNALKKSFKGAAGVYHLAGVVEHSQRQKDSMIEINLQGTLNAIEAAAEAGVRRMVYASTSGTVAVSKDEPTVPFPDDAPYAREVVANWPYYSSKLEAEERAMALAEKVLGGFLVNKALITRPKLLSGRKKAHLAPACIVV